MTEQVIAHKTTDGKIFEDEAIAEAHESALAIRAAVLGLVEETFPAVCDDEAITDWIMEYRDELLAAFVVPPHMLPGAFETVEEANAAGVTSGTLANGDTFGDEDDHPEGGTTVIEQTEEQIEGERDTLDTSTLDPEIPPPAPGEPRADDDIPF